MSDDPNRPEWPAPKPSWDAPAAPAEPPPPTVPTEPTGPAPTARPAWDAPPPGPPQPPRRQRFGERSVDIKLVIAVLIGLASVTGAVITWRAALLGEYATDKDRQAIAETVLVQQDEANEEVAVQDARIRFADHAIAQVAANQLLLQVDQFTAAGDEDAADAAREEAVEQQAVADRVLEGGPQRLLLLPFITTGADGVPVFDEAGFRGDLLALREAESQVQPVQTIREANRLRSESQRLVGWLVGVVAAVAVLTLAQLSRVKLLRLGLTAVATSMWIVCAALAYGSQ